MFRGHTPLLEAHLGRPSSHKDLWTFPGLMWVSLVPGWRLGAASRAGHLHSTHTAAEASGTQRAAGPDLDSRGSRKRRLELTMHAGWWGGGEGSTSAAPYPQSSLLRVTGLRQWP